MNSWILELYCLLWFLKNAKILCFPYTKEGICIWNVIAKYSLIQMATTLITHWRLRYCKRTLICRVFYFHFLLPHLPFCSAYWMKWNDEWDLLIQTKFFIHSFLSQTIVTKYVFRGRFKWLWWLYHKRRVNNSLKIAHLSVRWFS